MHAAKDAFEVDIVRDHIGKMRFQKAAIACREDSPGDSMTTRLRISPFVHSTLANPAFAVYDV